MTFSKSLLLATAVVSSSVSTTAPYAARESGAAVAQGRIARDETWRRLARTADHRIPATTTANNPTPTRRTRSRFGPRDEPPAARLAATGGTAGGRAVGAAAAPLAVRTASMSAHVSGAGLRSNSRRSHDA